MPIPHKLLWKIIKEGTGPNSLNETSIALKPKLDKDTTRKENYKDVFSIAKAKLA